MNFISGLIDRGSLFQLDATPQYSPGAEARTRDGRRFRYAKAGATAPISGQALQGPYNLPNFIGRGLGTSTVIGEKTITIPPSLGVAAENYFASGLLQIVLDNPASIMSYGLDKSPAINNNAATLTLARDEVFLAAGNTFNLIPCPWIGVIRTDAPLGAVAVGLAIQDMPPGQWGWIQTGGPAVAGVTGAPTIGAPLSVGVAATSWGAFAAPADTTTPIVATMLGPSPANHLSAILLNFP